MKFHYYLLEIIAGYKPAGTAVVEESTSVALNTYVKRYDMEITDSRELDSEQMASIIE